MKFLKSILNVLLIFVVSFIFCAYSKDLPRQRVKVTVNGSPHPSIYLYKVGEKTSYFSVKELSKIFDASLEWHMVSFLAIMNINNTKIEIKANSNKVIYGKNTMQLYSPTLFKNNDIYVPTEFATSKNFLDVSGIDCLWNADKNVLSITRQSNISSVEHFTEKHQTKVVIELEKSLPYDILKGTNSVTLEILGGLVNKNSVSVNDGIIENIVYETIGRKAMVKINLDVLTFSVEVKKLKNPERISVGIACNQDKDTVINNLQEETFAKEIVKETGKEVVKEIANETVKEAKSTQENDFADRQKHDADIQLEIDAMRNLGQAKLLEMPEIVENEDDTKELAKTTVKYSDENIVDDSYTIIKDEIASSNDVKPEKKEKEKEKEKNDEDENEKVLVSNLSVSSHKKLIVLDAGHGGKDPGAIGPNGIKEKDINLAIVKELKILFDRNKNFETLLTRSGDYFVALAERTNLANEKKADLFVSVHCNSNLNRNANGFEIYFLSENASDTQAAATAALENAVVELEGKPTKKLALIQKMLWSMVANEFLNESSQLCGFIASEAPKRTKIKNNGVKQANFFVLRGTQMPSTLVESAFISNYSQETMLNSKKFQVAIADTVYEGVVRYYDRKDKQQKGKK
jgi:N-acetylmuramoyl-L-alanine amidase